MDNKNKISFLTLLGFKKTKPLLLLFLLLFLTKATFAFESLNTPILEASIIDADTNESLDIETENILVTVDIPTEIFEEEKEILKVDLRVIQKKEIIFVQENQDIKNRFVDTDLERTKTEYLFSLDSTLQKDDKVEMCFTLVPSRRGACVSLKTKKTKKDVFGDSTSSQVSKEAQGRDVSELILAMASENLEQGDLVAISAEIISFYGISIIKATQPYQKELIGVISTEPGITLGQGLPEADDYKPFPVALIGTVPTKVSIENGPIEIGDPITSSAIPGVGMKASQAGRVVGMALEPYNSQEIGKITILVNPHWVGFNLTVQENGTGQIVNLSPEELRQTLASLGLVINEYGTLEIQTIKAKMIETEELKIQPSEKAKSGITISDRATGQPHCVFVENGQMQVVPGECLGGSSSQISGGLFSGDTTDPDTTTTTESTTTEEATATETTTTTEATITEEIVATTTEATTTETATSSEATTTPLDTSAEDLTGQAEATTAEATTTEETTTSTEPISTEETATTTTDN